MKTVVVERRFDPPLTEEQLRQTEERMASCLALYDVQWIRSYWSEDRRRMICHYHAPTAESVREVQREAGASFDTAWVADVLES